MELFYFDVQDRSNFQSKNLKCDNSLLIVLYNVVLSLNLWMKFLFLLIKMLYISGNRRKRFVQFHE